MKTVQGALTSSTPTSRFFFSPSCQHSAPSACGAPRLARSMGSCVNVSALSSCTADTLFYPGADVDTHMLELLQPWESHVVYMDGMLGKEDREENAKMNYVAEDFGKNHQDDHRSAYRHTSNIFRPCTDIRCAGPLTNLLYQRLVHNPAFKNVRVSKNLSVHFNMRGVSRKLQYHVNGFEEFIESTYLRKHLRGRVSKYVLSSQVRTYNLVTYLGFFAVFTVLYTPSPREDADIARGAKDFGLRSHRAKMCTGTTTAPTTVLLLRVQ